MEAVSTRLADVIAKHEVSILSDWVASQTKAATMRADLITEADLREDSRRFLGLVRHGMASGSSDAQSAAWSQAREFLGSLSASRARAGFSPSETATFVFSLKQPMFAVIRRELGRNAEEMADALWTVTMLVDSLGLYTTEVYQKGREEIILRQQQEMLELSTPVVTLWEGVLALPLIGTLDSARTQVVMESLLEKIVETGASIAIIDITGVPTVDTLVAQHLLKTVVAARLMGAHCIISGIRPQIAQTIVTLGIQFGDIPTQATLAGALRMALDHVGVRLSGRDTAVAPRTTPAGA
jgi:rsbT co-antagonist protein RsbR